jgi:hypothetical protein
MARQIDVDYLVKGVDPGIRAARSHDDRFLAESKGAGQRGPQETDHGVVLRLVGEPAELLAVIGQVEAPALRGA